MKIACFQANVAYGDPATNALAAIEKLRWAAGQGIELMAFPEAYLTGYSAGSREDAERIAIEVTHDAIAMIADAVRETRVAAIIGFIGKESAGLYNGALFLAPEKRPYVYQKAHLPQIGCDNYVMAGNKLELVDFQAREGLAKIGILICFDMRYPEATRTLAVEGADLIVLPTNWPEGAENSADIICIARAAENKIFFATCDRVGSEGGFNFLGRSKIIAPSGAVLASAGDQEEVIVAELDLALAREKKTVTIPGIYEIDVMGKRRPDLYRLG
ncbi:MAG: carbon-nitrogen hydrolase family protein [Fimbriimonadaceae bacterium]